MLKYIFVVYFLLWGAVDLHAKIYHIKSKTIKLSKKNIKNKNIRFVWNSKKKHIQIKRKNRTIQYINFGVKPSNIQVMDVNFDGYGDMVVNIQEDSSGMYVEDGENIHHFYYLYDRKQKKFNYHEQMTTMVYDAMNASGDMHGFTFNTKKKELILGCSNTFFYGNRVYGVDDRTLTLKKKFFRLFPNNYPDGVEINYIYKHEKLTRIKAYKDGQAKKRKSVKMDVTSPKILDSREKVKLPDINATLEKTLVDSLHALFENHQIETFNQIHFYDRQEVEKETDLMNVAIMLDTLFRTDIARTKEDTLFELIEKFSKIKKLSIDKFNYDKVQGFYEVDVRLHFKNSVEKYQWHFFKKGKLPYSKKGIYFLPIAYGEKREEYLLLNENFIFDYEGHNFRMVHKKDVLQLLTFWEYEKGKKGWFTAQRECRDKYIEFSLYDYTGDGNLEWLVSCRNKLQHKRPNAYQIRYGGSLLFNVMSVVNANSYTWNEKQRRFVFKYKGSPRNSYEVFRLAKSSDDNHTYFKRGIGDMYWQVEAKGVGSQYITTYGEKIYADKKVFEKSFHEDTICFKEARPRVKKGTKLYFNIEDIKKNKVAYALDANTPLMPIEDGAPVHYWDKNVSKTEPAMYLINVIYNKRVYWMDRSKLKKEGTK